MNYVDFLEKKTQLGGLHGFEPTFTPDFLFDFQSLIVDWAIRKERAAIFADCGLGKTPMQLAWAENIIRHTNGRVLILTPLAVGRQTVKEAAKFDIQAERSAGHLGESRIVVTNYEKLHHFNPSDFSGVVCDESSAIKSFNGVRRKEVTEFMRKIPYRLLATATAAPNDYIELGTSSEALGEMGHMDMLGRFFKNDHATADTRAKLRAHGGTAPKWRFKGHAELPFWRWVCSWARACRRPSDLGFDDNGFILPPLEEVEHIVESRTLPEGMLFSLPAVGLREEREERRRTIAERCEKAAELVADTGEPAVIWCHLNDEGDLLEKLIPDGRQVCGGDSDEFKEEAYQDFEDGRLRVLIIKPKIGAWGLNWQHCAHVVSFASHSYEQHYQAVRRCWRFGQKRPVRVDLIASEGEAGIRENLRRKQIAADRMFSHLVENMNSAMKIKRTKIGSTPERIPQWL